MIDDSVALLNMFSYEMEEIFSEIKLESPQTVITSRKDIPDLQRLTCKMKANFITILISPLEVAIREGITTVSVCVCVFISCLFVFLFVCLFVCALLQQSITLDCCSYISI